MESDAQQETRSVSASSVRRHVCMFSPLLIASGPIQSPFGTSGETAYDAEESLAGDQGFVLVDRYGRQQGGGLNSLVSLQV